MRVLIINASPRRRGNSDVATKELLDQFEKNGVETELYNLSSKPIMGCQACRYCISNKRCAIDDDVNVIGDKIKDVDGLVVITPTYYAAPSGPLLSFMQRLFYSNEARFTMKVGAAVVACRRAGATPALDTLQRFFLKANMIVVGSEYWNILYGHRRGDGIEDVEGRQALRVLANNITFVMKSLELGKDKFGTPDIEPKIHMNFIRSTIDYGN